MRRGLTLVETLIALVLLAALGAIIVPALLDSLEERSFETAADITNEQLMLARAHAQATGTPVEVTYSADQSKVQARMFAPGTDGAATPASGGNSRAQPPENGSASSDAQVIEEPWATRTLARGIRLTTRPPASFDPTQSSFIADEPASSKLTAEELWEALGQGQEVRLAVFMPDGSALVGDRVWLNDRKGRQGVFTINPWSGLPLFERLANLVEQRARNAGQSQDQPRQ